MSSFPARATALPLVVIPVLDLKDRVVVRAVGGTRDRYAPIATPLSRGSDPLPIAAALAERVGHRQLYVADLDALGGNEPAWDVHAALVAAGCSLWLDLGLRDVERARAAACLLRQGRGGWHVIAALESLPNLSVLASVLEAISTERLIFSLDLRQGRPMSGEGNNKKPPLAVVDEVLGLGVQRMIVLDVAGVGRESGPPTLELCRVIRRRAPELQLVSGGGVRGVEDLKALRDAGCDAALVSTWLHT